MNRAGDRDKVVLVGHPVTDVRIISTLASDVYFAVVPVPYGSPSRLLRSAQTSVVEGCRAGRR